MIALDACSAANGGWVVAVAEGQKSFTFQAFASKADADAKQNGTTYTVDLSSVTYQGA